MKKEEILKAAGTPISASPVPKVMHRFNKREHIFVYYKTDKEALRKVVPEPLEIEEPIVRFELMKMHDVTGFGTYCECGQAIPVTFNGKKGEYLHMMYVDSFDAIVSGREVHAYPKKLGWPRLTYDDNTILGTLDYGINEKIRVANLTMDYKYKEMSKEDALKELTEPVYMLKIIPNYDASPRVCELVEMQNSPSDIEILEAYEGDARLQLFDHIKCPLNDLPVKEIISAKHIICNLTLGRPKPIYDYLKD